MHTTNIHCKQSGDVFRIVSADGGCGVGAVDTLGFSCPETGHAPRIIGPVHYDHVISAHAPSEIVVDFFQCAEIAAATNASFQGSAVDAWIGWHWIGQLVQSSAITPWITLHPGRYVLKFETDRKAGAHTLWLIRSTSKNMPGVALVTVACYPKHELTTRCRRLFRSAAKRGSVVFVDGVDRRLGTLSEAKILQLRQFIDSIPESYQYIVFSDAIDTLVLKPIDSIAEAIASYENTIIISGEDNSWPVRDDDWTALFLSQHNQVPRPYGPFITNGRAIHPFLNSGNWAGHRRTVIDCLEKLGWLYHEMKAGRRPPIASSRSALPRNDQFVWQTAYLTGLVSAVIDVEWKLFACPSCSHCFVTDNDFFAIECDESTVRFRSSNGFYPWIVHWPGPGKKWLHLWDGLC